MPEHPLAREVYAVFTARGLTLATAESCTGGLIGHLVTTVPGSSEYYLGGIIAYSNRVKESWLGVPAEILRTVGAVSR
ncbi:MAG: CinA family protein, partial [Thermomicrobium sp.]|nr:CinA family protein [Thermomicrobium sp.]MDW8006065.1 CinA family protein [Thermomicrobium sp.]